MAGTKHIAELIVFTGRLDAEELRRLVGIASHPVECLAHRDNNQQLKIRAAEAKLRLKRGRYLSGRIELGHLAFEDVSPRDQALLRKLAERTLLREANTPMWILAMAQRGTSKAMSPT